MYDVGAPMPLGCDDDFAGMKPRSQDEVNKIPQHILDSAADDLSEKQFRSDAMAIALTWVDEGDYTEDALTSLVSGMADVDEEGEISESDEGYFDDLMTMTADALVELGGDPANVRQLIEEGDNGAGEKLGNYLHTKLDYVSDSDDEVVSRYAVSESLVLDSTQKMVRDGRVVLKKKPLRKKKLSSAQKQALKKARRKANTSAARKKRAKSMKVRKGRGM